MNKIYLLMEATGSWDDYRNSPIDSFTSKELAEKAANGFSDTVDSLILLVPEKLEEANRIEDEFIEMERTSEEESIFYKKFYNDYGFYFEIQDRNPTYSVQEIDLIN